MGMKIRIQLGVAFGRVNLLRLRRTPDGAYDFRPVEVPGLWQLNLGSFSTSRERVERNSSNNCWASGSRARDAAICRASRK